MSFVLEYGYNVDRPSSVPTLAQGTAGSLGVGLYSYKITYTSAFGETEPSDASANFATGNGGILLTNIPISLNPETHHRKIYRTTSGGSVYLFVAELFENTTTIYQDHIADGSIGPAVVPYNTAMSLEIVNGFQALGNPFIGSTLDGITAGAGGITTTAVRLNNEFNFVSTVATPNDGVKLLGLNFSRIGVHQLIKNNSASALRVFPSDGQSIDAYGADNPVVITAGGTGEFVAKTADSWTQTVSIVGGGAGSSLGFAMFWGMAPPDYAATVAVGAPLDFPRAGPTGGLTAPVRTGVGLFSFPVIGTYNVAWQASVTEAGQLQLSSSASGLNLASVASRTTGTSQISNNILITTTVINEVISILNPPGNATALTITPADGSLTHAPAPSLTIIRLS